MTDTPLPRPGRLGPELDTVSRVRYSRHVLLPEIGEEGQRRLAGARVLVLGAGGLGAPVLTYLAAAGVGTIGIVDDDLVESSNLQRQVVHREQHVGMLKVESAALALRDVNPAVRVEQHRVRLSSENALDLLRQYDVVVDGCDNFPTRYLVSDACEITGTPCVWGSVYRFEGQVSVFWSTHGPTYRDLFAAPPPPGAVPSCAEGGVLGALCGMVGATMAIETVKLLVGAGRSALGRVLVLDALDLSWWEYPVRRDPMRAPVTGLTDYRHFCGVPTRDVEEDDANAISPSDLAALLDGDRPPVLVDVREPAEAAIVAIPGSRLVPLAGLTAPEVLDELRKADHVVLYCKSGARSQRGVRQLAAAGISDATSLDGGVLGWIDHVDPSLTRY